MILGGYPKDTNAIFLPFNLSYPELALMTYNSWSKTTLNGPWQARQWEAP